MSEIFEIDKKYKYKDICEIKGEETKRGNPKIAQIKRWNNVESWLKEGIYYVYKGQHSSDIIEQNELNKTYNEIMEIFIYKYLSEQNGYQTTLTLSKFAEVMCFKNKNHQLAKYKALDIVDLVNDNKLVSINNNITADAIEDFFRRTNPNYNTKIKNIFNKMEKAGLISYRKYLNLTYQKNRNYGMRRATPKEEEIFLEIGNEILSNFPLRENEDGQLCRADKTNLTRDENFKFYKSFNYRFIKAINEHNKNDDNTYERYYHEYEIIRSNKELSLHAEYKLENLKVAINQKTKKSLREKGNCEDFINWFIDADTSVDLRKLIAENYE